VKSLPGRLVLLGHPVGHSLSPAFQNAALRRAALPLTYEALDVPPAELDTVLTALVAERAAGNVTIPHKAQVAARCARLTPLAERVGAVNTFWTEDGTLVGDNTDVAGFREAFRLLAPDIDPEHPIAVLGAGGAARAVLAALEEDGFADVRVHGRTWARASELCTQFAGTRPIATVADAIHGAAVIVNATPVGLDGVSVPVDVSLLEPDAAVLDLVFGPNETPLVHAARNRGLRAIDGLTMLLAQGALAFERWFGIAPDRTVMSEAVAR
jgi:shikimate dehydrogenase